MAESIEVENYKKSVEKVVETWNKEIKKDVDALAKVNAELEKIEEEGQGKGKSADELRKERERLQKSIEEKKMSFELNLKLLEPPTKAPEKELVKLPGFVQEIIKKKGIPLGGGFVLKPDISFDFKKGKVKKVYVELVWEF